MSVNYRSKEKFDHGQNNNNRKDESHEKQDKHSSDLYVWGSDQLGQMGMGDKFSGKCYSIPKICSYNLVIRQVACGQSHSAFITSQGHIYTMGTNKNGELGINNRHLTYASTPCLVQDIAKLCCMQVSCGVSHTSAITEAGEVYSWGSNDCGGLGIGVPCQQRYYPTKVTFQKETRIYQVKCGNQFTIFLSTTGDVFTCGANDQGQLGLGVQTNQNNPCYVEGLPEAIREIACGYSHSLALASETNTVYAFGSNSFGELGNGSKKEEDFPVIVEGIQREVIVRIAAGHHSAAINERGELLVWGSSVFGEYLLPTSFGQIESRFRDVSIGGYFGAATDENGTVWTWGGNSKGELGVGDFEQRATPFPIVALKGRPVKNLSCGSNFVVALGSNDREKRIRNKLSFNNLYLPSLHSMKQKRRESRGQSQHIQQNQQQYYNSIFDDRMGQQTEEDENQVEQRRIATQCDENVQKRYKSYQNEEFDRNFTAMLNRDSNSQVSQKMFVDSLFKDGDNDINHTYDEELQNLIRISQNDLSMQANDTEESRSVSIVFPNSSKSKGSLAQKFNQLVVLGQENKGVGDDGGDFSPIYQSNNPNHLNRKQEFQIENQNQKMSLEEEHHQDPKNSLVANSSSDENSINYQDNLSSQQTQEIEEYSHNEEHNYNNRFAQGSNQKVNQAKNGIPISSQKSSALKQSELDGISVENQFRKARAISNQILQSQSAHQYGGDYNPKNNQFSTSDKKQFNLTKEKSQNNNINNNHNNNNQNNSSNNYNNYQNGGIKEYQNTSKNHEGYDQAQLRQNMPFFNRNESYDLTESETNNTIQVGTGGQTYANISYNTHHTNNHIKPVLGQARFSFGDHLVEKSDDGSFLKTPNSDKLIQFNSSIQYNSNNVNRNQINLDPEEKFNQLHIQFEEFQKIKRSSYGSMSIKAEKNLLEEILEKTKQIELLKHQNSLLAQENQELQQDNMNEICQREMMHEELEHTKRSYDELLSSINMKDDEIRDLEQNILNIEKVLIMKHKEQIQDKQNEIGNLRRKLDESKESNDCQQKKLLEDFNERLNQQKTDYNSLHEEKLKSDENAVQLKNELEQSQIEYQKKVYEIQMNDGHRIQDLERNVSILINEIQQEKERGDIVRQELEQEKRRIQNQYIPITVHNQLKQVNQENECQINTQKDKIQKLIESNETLEQRNVKLLSLLNLEIEKYAEESKKQVQQMFVETLTQYKEKSKHSTSFDLPQFSYAENIDFEDDSQFLNENPFMAQVNSNNFNSNCNSQVASSTHKSASRCGSSKRDDVNLLNFSHFDLPTHNASRVLKEIPKSKHNLQRISMNLCQVPKNVDKSQSKQKGNAYLNWEQFMCDQDLNLSNISQIDQNDKENIGRSSKISSKEYQKNSHEKSIQNKVDLNERSEGQKLQNQVTSPQFRSISATPSLQGSIEGSPSYSKQLKNLASVKERLAEMRKAQEQLEQQFIPKDTQKCALESNQKLNQFKF